MLIKKSFINGKIIFGNGEVILPLKDIDRVSVEEKMYRLKIYWVKSRKVPQILYTKRGYIPEPIYITTHCGIFKIDNVMSTWFKCRDTIISTDVGFISSTYSNLEIESLVTRINTILFLTSPILISDTNVTKEMSS